ncbi:hypothetical protein Q2K19_12505 [Micromonospora soli]|uniref:hypothetical protein n=1 Tax=Micromonospora sp. NBRC 110009 TaxID=3061627 RepID=UPI002672D257|nr:hypothetical protein [Micromonospora sp. NBRC 110009]WKU01222.1 hypothetical protein Q2K19_12505 [Micromonospora sp. NBRC 110009]
MSTQAATRQQAPDRAMGVQEAPRYAPMMTGGERPIPAPGTETKPSLRSTEFWVYVAAVIAVLAASQLVGKNSVGVDIFRANQAWFLITLLTLGYLGSRGLAKAGSNYRGAEERRARH